MNERTPALRPARSTAAAGGLLALALAAGCSSSGGGGGTVAEQPPTPSATSTDFLGPSSTPSSSLSATPTTPPSTTPSVDPSRIFHNSASGITLTVPDGYVIATSPAEAAARFPAVLGNGSDVAKRVTDAQTRLRGTTIMIAFHPPIGGLSDNLGLVKIAGQAASDPNVVQGAPFRSQALTSLTGAGAKNIAFTDTTISGVPAEEVSYSIAAASATVLGQQYYVVRATDVFILTVTASSAARVQAAASEITGSWTFS